MSEEADYVQNPLMPDLGKSGTHYAKTVKKLKCLSGTLPDPGMLFDCKPRSISRIPFTLSDTCAVLMCRSDSSFKENPAGISSMLFYHATIIIHGMWSSSVALKLANTVRYLLFE